MLYLLDILNVVDYIQRCGFSVWKVDLAIQRTSNHIQILCFWEFLTRL